MKPTKQLSLATAFIIMTAASALAATATSTLPSSKQEAEARGFTFFASHDEIVSLAKQEGRVDGIVSLDPNTFGPLTKAFRAKYPFLDLRLQEVTGSEATQRFLLEVQSGAPKPILLISAKIFIKRLSPKARSSIFLAWPNTKCCRFQPG